MNDLWPALWLSLRIASAATALTAAVGIPLAYFMTRRDFPGKSLLEALLLLPLVLPPTVVGYLIIVLLGARGWIGAWLKQWLNYSVLFRVEGAILAAALVSLPILYLPARAGFAGVDRDLEEAATIAGAGRLRLFVHVNLPMARRAIFSGLALAFARGLGEFGATLMVFGWQRGRMTLPISVYADYARGEFAAAAPAVLALSLVSLAVVIGYNRAALFTRG